MSKPTTTTAPNTEIIAAVQHWVDEVVVRHRFCPFAKPALESNWVSYAVLDGANMETILEQLAEQIAALLASGRPDATELLVLSKCAADFDDFLDLVALAEALIESMGWHDAIQFATFHPDYCFADTSPNSMENYTNRAPWPVIQLLQVDSVGRGIDAVGSTDDIPQRNIDHLNALDEAAADQLMRDSCATKAQPDVTRH